MNISSTEFTFSGGNKSAEYTLKKTVKDGVFYLDIAVSMLAEEIPEKFSLNWVFSGADCCSVWNPDERIHKIRPDWSMTKCRSRLASNMPIQQLVSFTGKNKLCVAVSDVDTPISINMGWVEENGNVVCRINFFTAPTNIKNSYKATVRLDTRNTEFYDSIYDTVAWWENECGYESAYVPESARQPMDSLWYSFHQNLEYDKILRECKNSRSLGMETVIIDDGWQTDDNSRGYAYCGDWLVSRSKMRDMAQLVNEIHKIGMKVILWYSVPFVGVYSQKYSEFKNCFLDGAGNGDNSFALDPRYKKVREYLIGIYENAVRDWGLDGLKLDFIDSFMLHGKSLEHDEKRDYQSLEDAIHALMGEIKQRLTAINPDILIEFRQSYVGPSIRKYGNMLRVGDCPGDIMANRSQAINLRFTSGKTAVHSDMIMWNAQDCVENAALQFASVIFTVPQISMMIEDLPADHIKMLEYYISFWKNNRDVLIDGKLTAENLENDYSQACSTLNGKSVVAVYTNPLIEVKTDECIAVNASGFESLIIKADKEMKCKTVNCMGDVLADGVVNAGLNEIKIPKGGMAFLSV